MQKINFDGQVAVVTGGGGGLGAMFCKELARRGAAVVVNDLGGTTTGDGCSRDFADVVVREIVQGGGKAIANYDSVATAEGGAAIIEAALSSYGRIDVVISNAGNQRNAPFGKMSEEDIDAVFAVHAKGAFHVCQPAYREMCNQGYGRIVLVSSQSGIFGNPIRANYGAAKTSLIGLMNVIAQEAPPGICVNALFPNAQGGRLGGTPLGDRPDIDFLMAAGERARHYSGFMSPDYVTGLACYMASRQCDTSQNMYSALGGKFSRIFIGLSKGWVCSDEIAPTCDDIFEHIAEIDSIEHFDLPKSGLDEMDTVVAARPIAQL